MGRRKEILFITPGATSDGGNVFLLRFLHWLKKNSDIPFSVFYGYNGDLLGEFEKLGETYALDPRKKSDNLLEKITKKLERDSGLRSRRLSRRLAAKNLGLIFSNSVINHSMLPLFENSGVPVLSYCHEMESVIHLTGIEKFRKTCEMTTHFVAVSLAVEDELIRKQGVAGEDVTTIHGFLPLDDFDPSLVGKREEVRKTLGFPHDAFLVGASGSLNWRKAPEVFIRLAGKIANTKPDLPIYFVWIGGALEGDHPLYCARYDVNKLGLENRVMFLPHDSNPSKYFAALDVFAMVSREDPFPLVCLESAVFGVPVICFENAGGMPEFVEGDCGFVVPYLDTDLFAEKIVELHDNPELRVKLGKNAASKIRTAHDIEIAAPRILRKIEEMMLT